MRRRSAFGPRPAEGGGTLFRLWAPGLQTVGVQVGVDPPRPMSAVGGGWFEVHDKAGPRDLYRFALQDGLMIADPASLWQPDGPHGPSCVPEQFIRPADVWRGRPWAESVVYELHVGAFTPEGTFAAARSKLPYLAEIGITVIELMPIASMPGARGWGYDGVLLWAPHHTYGSPSDLVAFVADAHAHGLAVYLDLVLNHFGPDGNYLPLYCPCFFRSDIATPWGSAIDYRLPEVRAFAIDNALHWLGDYGFDGLRLDAIHAIHDDGPLHLVDELVATALATFPDRHLHVMLENERNEARRLGPQLCTSQWNDDWHHGAHVLATGETEAYYRAFADGTLARFGRSLAEGFVYQGEPFPVHDDQPRGEPSAALPPTAFVSFLQNHDQVGNRALGERLSVLAQPRSVEVLTALLLLSPQVPMLFMGEEWGSERPFLFFCDFEGDVAQAVRDGRRREFASFAAFSDPEARARIPDPTDITTFTASKLDWRERSEPVHAARLRLVRRLIGLRAKHVTPSLDGAPGHGGHFEALGPKAMRVGWRLARGAELHMVTNFGDEPAEGVWAPPGAILFAWPDEAATSVVAGRLPGWATVWHLVPGETTDNGEG